MRLRKAVLLMLAVGVALGAASCGSKTDVAFRPQAGDARVYRVNTDVSSQFSISGMEVSQGVTGGFDVSFETQAPEPQGGAAVKGIFGDMNMKMMLDAKVGGMSLDMNQLFGGSNPMEKAMDAAEGKTFTVQVGPKGEVRDVQGMSQIRADVRKAMEDALKDSMRGNPMAQQISQGLQQGGGSPGDLLFDADGAKQWLRYVFPFYPPEKVSVGYAWETTEQEGGPYPSQVTRTFKVASIENGRVTVTYDGAIKTNVNATPAAVGPGSGRLELAGNETGRFVVDEKTGWLVESESTVDASGTVNIEGNMMNPQGGSFPITLKTQSKVAMK